VHRQDETQREIPATTHLGLLLVLLFAATTLNYGDRQAFPAAGVRIKSELQLNNEEYGQVEGDFGLAFAFGGLLGGVLADSVSVRWLYALVLLLWSGAGMATGWATGYETLWLSRVGLGFFASTHWACALRTTQRVFPPGKRPLANSILQAGAPVGAILPSIFLLGFVSGDGGTSWRDMFWCLGALGVPWVIGWLLVVKARDLTRDVEQTDDDAEGGVMPMEELGFFSILASRRFWVLMWLVICINTCWHFIRVWLPIALEDELRYTPDEAQSIMIGYWVATFAGSLACGWLTSLLRYRGWGTHRARLAVFLGFSIVTSLTVIAAALPPSWFFVALLLFVGFGSLGQFPIYYSLVQELSATNQAKVGGVLGFSTWAVLYFMHPRVGRVMDQAPDLQPYIFGAMGVLPLLSWLTLATLWKSRPTRGAE